MGRTFTDARGLDYEVFKFKYFHHKDRFIFLGDLEKNQEHIKEGEFYVLIPSWYEMHEIYRLSTGYHPVDREPFVHVPTYKDNKIKFLLKRIVDGDGQTVIPEKKLIEHMDAPMAVFILNKIDEVIQKYYYNTGLSEDDKDKLVMDCFNYYRAKQKSRYDPYILVPSPPAIIVLMQLCERFTCVPMEARKIWKGDLDAMMIASEQENITKNPDNIGLSDKNKHIRLRR